jgi:site-specific DNA recombinase
MKRVAIYARVSLANGTQDYQRQINDLSKVILGLGYTQDQIEIFAERISGYKKKSERPELSRMLNHIENNNQYFECVYVTEISRLGRNPRETRDTIEQLTDYKLPIFIQSIGRATLDANGNRDSIMSIILQVLMEFAHSESEQMKSRSRSGLLTSAKAGRAGGGAAMPFGYTKGKDKMLIVDEEESVIVKEIFDLYEQGNGIKVISGILNSRGVPTRYNKEFAGRTLNFQIAKEADKIKWSDNTIYGIVTNTLYKGQRKFKGEIIYAPRIVSNEQFGACEALRMTKTHKNKLTSYTYLLKDKMSCGCCGRNYYARYKPTLEGDKVYVCSSALIKGERCPNKGINIMLLETAIFNQLVESDAVLKYISETQDIKKELEKDVARLENQLKTEQTLLPAKQSEKARLLDGFLKGYIIPEVFEETDAKLNVQLANIEKKITIISKEMSEKNILIHKQSEAGTTKKMLEAAVTNRTQLQAIFKQIIHKVIINDLTSKLSLATVYIQIDGVVLKNTLKLIIDKISIRKKELRYVPIRALVNDPVFKENILLVDKQDIINELSYTIEPKDWIKVENLLLVEPILENKSAA